MPRDTGGPAFPRSGFYPDTESVDADDLRSVLDTRTQPTSGMTLRDFFAAQALRSLVTLCVALAEPGQTPGDAAAKAAFLAYLYADAMVAQRSK